MTDGEILFLFVGFIAGIITTLLCIFIPDYSTYRELQKKMRKERGIED